MSKETGRATYVHPLEKDYRALVRMMRGALKEDVTYNEVTQMAAYLGIPAPSQEPLLMWIARQAVLAPLPAGWEERRDGQGAYYVDAVSGACRSGGGAQCVDTTGRHTADRHPTHGILGRVGSGSGQTCTRR